MKILANVKDSGKYFSIMVAKGASCEVCPERGDIEDLRLFHAIKQLHHALFALLTCDVGVPPTQFAIVGILGSKYPQHVGLTELVKRIGINAAAITRQIQELEDERFVLRKAGIKDKRRCFVRLSAKGYRVYTDVHHQLIELEQAMLVGIAPQALETTLDVLSHVTHFIKERRR